MTSVSNALVSVDATNCHGEAVHLETHAGADGRWTIAGIPAADAQVTISVGSFVLHAAARVNPNSVTPLDTTKTCFRGNALKMAVISGSADHIETLLTQLGFAPDIVDGSYPRAGSAAAPALAFLADSNRLSPYQILFIDCGAFKKGAAGIDLGANARTILANLRAFVAAGGSIYASDWAGVLLALAYPQQVALRLATGGDTDSAAITSPFSTDRLVGFAPQQVSASVPNPDLASYLGTTVVGISFPSSPPTNHWALLAGRRNGVTADIVADVSACDGGDCRSRGPLVREEPLAISFRPDESRAHGGNIIFTSFHNISQPTEEVKKILQYLIFRL